MATEKPDKNQNRSPESDPFLAAVDAKITALHTLRASYVAAVSIGAFGQSGDLAAFAGVGPAGSMGSMGGAPLELPRGALLGKSIPAAIKLYLATIKKKQTLREIANALRDGGVETTAKNFETPVQSAIYRLQTAGEVLRFKEGWALAEFYPEGLRNRIAEKDAKPRKSKKRPARKARATKPVKPNALLTAGHHDELAGRIETFMREHGEPVEPKNVAATLGVALNVVSLAFGRLKKQQRITKAEDGTYSHVG
jgi:hypothetical protein